MCAQSAQFAGGNLMHLSGNLLGMSDKRVSRRWVLAAAGVASALAGCTDGFGGDRESTPTAAETPPSAADTPTHSPTRTATQTPTPEASPEVVDTDLRADTVPVGDPIEVEALVGNTGGAAGTADLLLSLGAETERREQVEVPAGEQERVVLTSSDTSQAGTVTVSVNGEAVGTVTVEPPPVLHVAPGGDDDNPGTEAAPMASIDAAVSRAGPGETVHVHPGEYLEFVEFREDGESDAPITLTGPPDAVLKPPKDVDYGCIGVGASHIHITGLTVSGLYDSDAPRRPDSYTPGHLITLNTWAEDSDDYLEGLVVSPHRIGNAGGALINSVMLKDCDIGGFEVIGPAGAQWLFDEEEEGHYGEIVYLGTASDNRAERGYDEYDRTRNIRVHHIDNSAGHPHSELVDIKEGAENITVEYCTDGGGVQSEDSHYSQAVQLGGTDCTIRWNVLQNAQGSGLEIGPWGFLRRPGEFLAAPQTEFERQLGTGNAIYGNVFTGNSFDAIDFLRESRRPEQDGNPRPGDQRALCGNLFDGFSDAEPSTPCPSDIPSGDGVGHLGGDSPWAGNAPTREEVFSRDALATNLETTVEANDVPTNTEITATVTLTNDGARSVETVFRLRVREHVLSTERVSAAAGETREVTLSTGGISNPEEVSITRNGQKIGAVRVTDGG